MDQGPWHAVRLDKSRPLQRFERAVLVSEGGIDDRHSGVIAFMLLGLELGLDERFQEDDGTPAFLRRPGDEIVEVVGGVGEAQTPETIDDGAHLTGLLAATCQANPQTARDRLRLAVPRTAELFERLAARGESLRAHTARLLALRRLVRVLRPQASPVVYRRLTTLMGEVAQVDWGAFGTVRIGHGTWPLSGFAMVLSYSRALFALFTLDQTLESFLRGHVEAFQTVWRQRADPGSRLCAAAHSRGYVPAPDL